MSKISVIVFDLGNVLIPFDYKIIIDSFNKIEDGLGNKFYDLYHKNYHVHRQFERADISRDEFLSTNLDWLDNKVTEEEFSKIFSSLFTLNNDVAELLPKLKQNYTLVLLSNTNSIHRQYGWDHYEFLKYFDKLILSYEVGAYKPEPAIYKAVTNFTQKPNDEHIFIDDVQEYVEGAHSQGWDGIQFVGYESLTAELRGRGIIF